jgi:hypothetical protein
MLKKMRVLLFVSTLTMKRSERLRQAKRVTYMEEKVVLRKFLWWNITEQYQLQQKDADDW